jgi:magnesium transporter
MYHKEKRRRMTVLIYANHEVVNEKEARLPGEGEIGWLHLSDPTEAEIKHWLGEWFPCHPLVLEDILHFGQRPKLEHYQGPKEAHACMFFYAMTEKMQPREFAMIITDRMVITVTKSNIQEIDQVYQQAPKFPELMQSVGHVVYRILDGCVDEYFKVIDHLDERMDRLEERVFNHPEAKAAHDIFHLKRLTHRVRRIATECRNVVGMISHETFPYTDDRHVVYFVDVYDHASRIVDALDSARDNLSGLLDLQTSQRANRMNEVMKTLTIIATIFLPLSFVVGLYGMNFHDIPELGWKYGYLYCWGVMLAISVGLLWFFKRKGWW